MSIKLKQNKIIICILFIWISCQLFSCKAKPTDTAPLETKISGRVIDKDANSLISNVQITTNPITSSVTTDASGTYVINDVKPGQYVVLATKSGYKSNSINITVAEGKTASADIQLETLKPDLSLSVTSIDFNTSQTTSSFIISNGTSTGTINYTITKNADWLTITPTSGSITTGAATINIVANRAGLSIGNYSAIITINTNVGSKDLSITMTIPNPNAPQLTVSPLLLDYGSSLSQLAFTIRNSGTGKIDWTANSSQSWISVVPSSDSTRTEVDEIKVNVNRAGLPPTNYTGEVIINSNAGLQTVNVKMTVQSVPVLSISTATLDFDSTKSQLSFNINNTGSGTLNWSVSGNQNWISVLPASGTNAGSVNVTISRTGLSVGVYTGQVSITSNGGTQSIDVSMSVQALPSMNVSTTTLDFDSIKTQLSFLINNTGSGTLNWSISDNQNWLSTQPISGTNSGTINVTVSRAGLSASNYSGQITVSSNGGNANISVNMKVPTPSAGAPIANFVADKTSGMVPLDVQFTDQSVGDVTSWLWDFGDGNTSTIKNPTHTYNTVDSFSVVLTVNGPSGSDSRTRNKYIYTNKIFYYESFDSLKAWTLSNPYVSPNGWYISPNGYNGKCAGFGASKAFDGIPVDQYIEKEFTLASDGTVTLWAKRSDFTTDGSIYIYLDEVLKYSHIPGQGGSGVWKKVSFAITKGVRKIKIRDVRYQGADLFDELIISSP